MESQNSPKYQALEPKYRLLVLLVSIGFFMQALDTTIVNTALPAMAQHLREDPLHMHGVVVAYVLSVATCIPLSGWLADRFGLRVVYLSAIIIFTLASLGCGLSNSLELLIFFRVLQGMGGALLLPVGRLSLLRIIPRDQFLSAINLMSLAGLVGPLIGPTLGGWLVEVASWHWIFLLNIPMGILGVLVTLKALPNIVEANVKRFDISGVLMLIVAMVGLTLGIDSFSVEASSHLIAYLLLAAGLIASTLYAHHAYNQQHALFRSDLFRHEFYVIGILGNFFARFAGNAIPFILPLLLQVVFQFSPFETGLMMIPLVLGSLFSKPIVRPLIQHFGYRNVLLINTVAVGLCVMSFTLTTATTPEWLRALHFFLFGTLNSIQFVSMNTYTLKDLPSQHASSGNSFLSMIMMLSMSIGIALTGTLINFYQGATFHFSTAQAFDYTLITLGIINVITMLVFWKIPKENQS
ncbi:multidrug transporter subunit MdtD [Acinetobacter sp. MB5]|uniref:multidrug transporter subunit MdtD n=1 Tax=Acinetobacter sp. MB5 TaxID=2069438 RepID=UPI000DD06DB6|nr:multidrug transporter subunit MdtD [Acinetobacter sp. MB5]